MSDLRFRSFLSFFLLAAPVVLGAPARAQSETPATTSQTVALSPEGEAAAPAAVSPPVAAANPQPVPTISSAPAQVPSWTRNLSVGGGAILWYYQPFLAAA